MTVCGVWGLAPSEFWRMSPQQLFWYVESKLPPEKPESVFDDKWLELASRLD